MSTLDEIGLRYGTDKSSLVHGFLEHYERFLAGRKIRSVFEIGVHEGASLRMWRDFFSEAEIFGCDNNRDVLIREPKIVTYQCDQADTERLRHILMTCAIDPDLFIDDGSHRWSHQIHTYNSIYPMLKQGAVYIVEDLHSSMWPEAYGDYAMNPLQYFSSLKNFTIVKTESVYTRQMCGGANVLSMTGIGIKE